MHVTYESDWRSNSLHVILHDENLLDLLTDDLYLDLVQLLSFLRSLQAVVKVEPHPILANLLIYRSISSLLPFRSNTNWSNTLVGWLWLTVWLTRREILEMRARLVILFDWLLRVFEGSCLLSGLQVGWRRLSNIRESQEGRLTDWRTDLQTGEGRKRHLSSTFNQLGTPVRE